MKLSKVLFVLIFLWGCGKENDTVSPEIEELQDNNKMIFLYNGAENNITVSAEKNSYKENEIVLRGSSNLDNTLMLTFSITQTGNAEINKDMTGYWDLGLCTPTDKSLLTNDESNFIKIISYDSSKNYIEGEFNLKFRQENDTTIFHNFSNGKFKAIIDTSYVFEYCEEG